MLDKEPQRLEMGKFLRSRRERIDPSTVGLPAGRRRRTAGLRREDVAILAGLSPTWYTYIEQGRDINPSSEVLDSLAQVLQLSEGERSYLHLLSCGRLPPPSPVVRQPSHEKLLWEIVWAFDSRCPVYAVTCSADVLAWNDAAEKCYTNFAKLPDQQRNIAWWMFTEPEARERFVDWEGAARNLVGRLRTMAAKGLDNERLTYLVNELSDLSPEFRAWWSEYPVSSHDPDIVRFRHSVLGVQARRLVAVSPNVMGNEVVVLHLPTSDGAGALRFPSYRGSRTIG
ncbi:MmyB family transcriptional regulator [Nocardia sp. R6R-6]|uniref:MmyB family transcriptional regulator n=1 Tax=Nocardia sp. R6R-6 TaxID=3459303 RepID=UPI00403E233A